jgi:hypothetical protein
VDVVVEAREVARLELQPRAALLPPAVLVRACARAARGAGVMNPVLIGHAVSLTPY